MGKRTGKLIFHLFDYFYLNGKKKSYKKSYKSKLESIHRVG